MAPPQKPRNVSARSLDGQQINHPDPHLPSIVKAQLQSAGTPEARFTARVCVNNDGRVYQVNVLSSIPGGDGIIVDTIKSWTYRPQPVSVCFVASIEFSVQ
jgi:hypothetical protein